MAEFRAEENDATDPLYRDPVIHEGQSEARVCGNNIVSLGARRERRRVRRAAGQRLGKPLVRLALAALLVAAPCCQLIVAISLVCQYFPRAGHIVEQGRLSGVRLSSSQTSASFSIAAAFRCMRHTKKTTTMPVRSNGAF